MMDILKVVAIRQMNDPKKDANESSLLSFAFAGVFVLTVRKSLVVCTVPIFQSNMVTKPSIMRNVSS